MSATRYQILDPSGCGVIGVVQGNGGVLSGDHGLARLRAGARGERHGCYEPSPGHVRVYPEFSAQGNGRPYDIAIVGATVRVVPWPA